MPTGVSDAPGRPPADLAVDVRGLHKSFGRFEALRGLDLTVRRGEVHGFLGPNGAGKSTTIRVLLGLLRADAGEVRLLGGDPWRDVVELHRRLAYVPGDVSLWPSMTGGEMIDLLGSMRGGLDEERRADLVRRFELDTTKRGRQYSKGNRQKVAIVAALASDVELLILDEPTSGLDPALDRQVMATLRRLADAGRVVLVVTHSLTYLSMCDQVLLLAPGGKTSFCGAPAHVEQEMGTSDWAEIFAYVADQPDAAHTRYLDRHRRTPNPPPPQRPPGPPIPVPHTSFTRQASTIARRQVRLVFADIGYLVFLVLLPVVLGLLTLVIPGSSGFARLEVIPNAPPPKDGAEAIQILVVLVVGAAFMGAALTVRDLVGERDIFERERAVGLRPGAYLFAKIVVFFVAAILQTIIMVGITFAGRGLPDFGGPILPPPLALLFAVAVLACVSTLVGLAISSAVKSNEQVMPPLVIVVMVQLVFCGGLFKLDGVGLQQLSWIFPSFWGYVTAAGSVDLYNINVAAPQRITLWETSIAHSAIAYAVLAFISILLLAFTYSRLRLKKR